MNYSPAWVRWQQADDRLKAAEGRLDACWSEYDATGKAPTEELLKEVRGLRNEVFRALDAVLLENDSKPPMQ